MGLRGVVASTTAVALTIAAGIQAQVLVGGLAAVLAAPRSGSYLQLAPGPHLHGRRGIAVPRVPARRDRPRVALPRRALGQHHRGRPAHRARALRHHPRRALALAGGRAHLPRRRRPHLAPTAATRPVADRGGVRPRGGVGRVRSSIGIAIGRGTIPVVPTMASVIAVGVGLIALLLRVDRRTRHQREPASNLAPSAATAGR